MKNEEVIHEETSVKRNMSTAGKGLEQKEKECLFDTLPKNYQLILLTLGMFVFFGTHNVLQEAIMQIPGFEFGVMLGYMDVIG